MLLFALARPVYLNTLVESNVNVTTVDYSSTSPCDDIDTCRTITDILWNCYSVIILSTWVAVHPNVPKHDDHLVVVLIKSGTIFFMAIVAPEMMILWALRQYVSCKHIAEKYKRYGWKKCHAFLVLMGGLALYDGDDYVCHLWDREKFNDSIRDNHQKSPETWEINAREMTIATGILDGKTFEQIKEDLTSNTPPDSVTATGIYSHYSCLLEFLLAKGHIHITEEEIKDTGHADALSKAIAIGQTVWFILQCSARVAQGLEVTAIEVITFAFAVLNFATFFLWWSKPLRVRHPVRVYWRPYPLAPQEPQGKQGDPKWYIWLWKMLKMKFGKLIDHCWKGILESSNAAAVYIGEDYQKLSEEKIFFLLRWRILGWRFCALFYPFAALSTRFRDLGAGCESDDSRYLFSSRLKQDTKEIYAAAYIVAVIFAAIHCIPWFFSFPTPIEAWIWRCSAVLIVSSPLVLGILHSTAKTLQQKIFNFRNNTTSSATRIARKLGILSAASAFWISAIILIFASYVVARLALIVLALTALRDLSREGYETVQWNAFLPHIG